MQANLTMRKMRIKLSNLKRLLLMLNDPRLVHLLLWWQNLEYQLGNRLIHISIALNRDSKMRKMYYIYIYSINLSIYFIRPEKNLKKSWNSLKNNSPPPQADRKRTDPPKTKTNNQILFIFTKIKVKYFEYNYQYIST